MLLLFSIMVNTMVKKIYDKLLFTELIRLLVFLQRADDIRPYAPSLSVWL